jgi:hypothetical protein
MNHSYCCYRLSGPFQNCYHLCLHRYFVVQDNRGVLAYLPPSERTCHFRLSHCIMTLSNIYMLPSSRLLQEYNRRPTIFQCLLNHHYLIISVSSSSSSSSFILLSCSLSFGITLSQSQV